jgi:hypothetical protein
MSARTSASMCAVWAGLLSFGPNESPARLLPQSLLPPPAAAGLWSGANGAAPTSPAAPFAGTRAAVAQNAGGSEDDEDEDDDEESDDETETESAGSSLDAATPVKSETSSRAPGSSSGSADAPGGATRSSAEDAADEVGAGAEVDSVTRSLWRGAALSAGPAFEPSAWLSCGDVSFELWMSLLLHDEPARRRVGAIDPTIRYAHAFRHFKIEASFTGYWPWQTAQRSSTAEAGLKLSAPWGPVRIVTAHAVDIDAEPGAYFGTLGLELRVKLGPLRLRAFSDLGWANSRFNRSHWAASSTAATALSGGAGLDASRVDRAAFDLAELGLQLRYALPAGTYLAPHAEGSTLLAAPLRHASGEPRLLAAGMALGVEY